VPWPAAGFYPRHLVRLHVAPTAPEGLAIMPRSLPSRATYRRAAPWACPSRWRHPSSCVTEGEARLHARARLALALRRGAAARPGAGRCGLL